MNHILNVAYNNYLTTYTPKSVTRYDTHKKSELRSVYNSIVKLNKDAPWYLPTTNKDTQRFAVDIKENARILHNSIAQIGGLEEDGLFHKKSAYSSDDDVITASYIGSEENTDRIPDLEIEVRALATTQENLGTFLPDVKTSLPPDTYSFDIAINDMNYEFQFSVGESETNREVQERLVRLINNSNVGIRADLSESSGVTSLRLTSESTGLSAGKKAQFIISDERTSMQAGAVEYFGLDYISREAGNAHFTINGDERTISSNQFTVGKLFEVHLNGLTEENQPVRIGLKTDVESLADNVSHLLGSYNDFIQTVSSYLDTQTKSKQLTNELKGIAGYYSSSLEAMGISMKDDGSLEINRNQLQKAALESDDISESFSGLKDFSRSLLRKSDQIAINPMNYVQKTVVAYKNPGHNYVSPYQTSSYSGMMFNYYC